MSQDPIWCLRTSGDSWACSSPKDGYTTWYMSQVPVAASPPDPTHQFLFPSHSHPLCCTVLSEPHILLFRRPLPKHWHWHLTFCFYSCVLCFLSQRFQLVLFVKLINFVLFWICITLKSRFRECDPLDRISGQPHGCCWRYCIKRFSKWSISTVLSLIYVPLRGH